MKKRIFLLCTIFISLNFGGCGLNLGGGAVDFLPGDRSCGDGTLESHEKCDTAITTGAGVCPTAQSCKLQGKLLAGDACLAHCIKPPEPPVCGDGEVKPPGELCDTAIKPGQPGACPTEADCLAQGLNLVGSGCLAKCGDPVACGNEKLDTGESCDTKIYDGVGKCPDEKSCRKDGKILVGSGCNAHCEESLCGDGNVQAKDQGEICDPDAPDGPLRCPTAAECEAKGEVLVGKGCQAFCEKLCGNTVVDHGESCDTAITAGLLGACPTTCGAGEKLINPASCNAKCVPTTCGDGTKDSGEACDSGIAAGSLGACETESECMAKTPSANKKMRYSGSPDSCDAKCEEVDLCDPNHFDGECPAGCDGTNDRDCQYGKECTDDAACQSGPFGSDGLCKGGPGKGGMCTPKCDVADPTTCPKGSRCIDDFGEKYCLKSCEGDTGACDSGVPDTFYCSNGSAPDSYCLYRPPVAKMKNVGKACEAKKAEEMCGKEGKCITQNDVVPNRTTYASGYCSADCTDKLGCDSDSICIGSASKAICMAKCMKDEDCQGGVTHGYSCVQISEEERVCVPLPNECTGVAQCDASQHETCVEGLIKEVPTRKMCAVVGSGTGKIGDDCNEVYDCGGGKNAVCSPLSSLSGAPSLCSISCETDGDCGDDTKYTCQEVLPRVQGRPTQKLCTKKCDLDPTVCDGSHTGLVCDTSGTTQYCKSPSASETLKPREMGGACLLPFGLFCEFGDKCVENNCVRECDPAKSDACPAASDCKKVTLDGKETHLCLAKCSKDAECVQFPNAAASGGIPMTCQKSGDAKDHCYF